jgi:hypothetical protein
MQPSWRSLSAGDSQEGGRPGSYNSPGTEYASTSQQVQRSEQVRDPCSAVKERLPTADLLVLRPQVYTIFDVDLTKFVTEDKQYAGMAPMERFLRDGGSSLQRKVTRPVLKALL